MNTAGADLLVYVDNLCSPLSLHADRAYERSIILLPYTIYYNMYSIHVHRRTFVIKSQGSMVLFVHDVRVSRLRKSYHKSNTY